MGLLKALSNKFYVAIMKCLNDRAPKIQSYKRKLTAGATRTGVIKQGTTLICPKFFRNEPWDKWMFDRKRSDGKLETDI